MLIITGSFALRFHGVKFDTNKRFKDIDLIGTYEEITAYNKSMGDRVVSSYPIAKGKKQVCKLSDGFVIESEIAYEGSNTEAVYKLIHDDDATEYDLEMDMLIPSLDVLYMLKLSHRYLRNSPFFLKTMRDIQAMRAADAKIDPRYEELFKVRESETYYYSHPKLNQSAGQFFSDDGIKYEVWHDDIHLAVATFDKPAYSYFKPIDSEVMVSMDMFFECPREIQLAAALEEAYTLAIERSLIPHPGVMTPRQAFTVALQKLASSISSGRFRNFVWENYDDVVGLYKEDYFERFKAALANGQIRTYQQGLEETENDTAMG